VTWRCVSARRTERPRPVCGGRIAAVSGAHRGGNPRFL